MDSFEQPGAPKLKNEDSPHPDDVTPTKEVFFQIETETPTIAPQRSATELSPLHGKSKKTAFLIILAVVLMLVLIGGVVWFVLTNNATQSDADKNTAGENSGSGDNEGEKPVYKPAQGSKIIELSVDDELVRMTYEKYDKTNGAIYTNEDVLTGKMPDGFMLMLARLNTEPGVCRGDDTMLEVYGEDFVEAWGYDPNAKARSGDCYRGNNVIAKVSEMFGRDVTLTDGYQIGSFTAGGQPHYKYDAELDEFWHYIVFGGGSGSLVKNALYMAERDNTRLYLYDVVGMFHICAIGDGSLGFVAGPIGADGSGLIGDNYRCKEEYVVDYVGADKAEVDTGKFLEHKDDFTKFKWTFVKNGESYVFEKLERV